MQLISPNFDVNVIIFSPIVARGLFPKLLEKALLKRGTLFDKQVVKVGLNVRKPVFRVCDHVYQIQSAQLKRLARKSKFRSMQA